MYLEPRAYIKIGSALKYLEFTQVNRIVITESVKELGNNAVITLPRNYKELDGKNILDLIKSGDPVSISLGYGDELFEEFKGFLQYPESSAPLVLHVDDEFYPLKRNNFLHTFGDGVKLKEVLTYIAPGYTITCPDVTLASFSISNVNSYQVLEAIKKQYGFYSKLNGTELICQWPYDINASGNIHTYEFYTPTVKDGRGLKYHRKEDVKIQIKAISNLRNGEKIKVLYPEGANNNDTSIRTLNFGALTKKQLTEFAKREYDRLAFDGYSGWIKGFGYPRVHAGDTIEIIDSYEPDREGNYLVEDTKIIYDLKQGYERKSTLSFKV